MTNRATIDAPSEAVWDVLYDVEALIKWQPDLTSVRCLARDELGRPVRVEMVLKTVVRTASAVLNFHYEPGIVRWDRHSGDVPDFRGSWAVEPIDAARTAVEYQLAIDFGRLGKLVRGPMAAAAQGAMGSSMPGKLKRYVEATVAAGGGQPGAGN